MITAALWSATELLTLDILLGIAFLALSLFCTTRH